MLVTSTFFLKWMLYSLGNMNGVLEDWVSCIFRARIFCCLTVGWCGELSSVWQINRDKFLQTWDPHKCVVGWSSAWFFIKILARQWACDLNYAPSHIHCVNLAWPIPMGMLAGQHTPSLRECEAGFLTSITLLSSFIHSRILHGTMENSSAAGMKVQDN